MGHPNNRGKDGTGYKPQWTACREDIVTIKRDPIPKGKREQVLKEYRHRCAVCASDRPQVHHIDENPKNNDLQNLIPLCPNCHLRDQHDPTAGIDLGILKLFRKYKDPIILSPQFNPLYRRFRYLYTDISNTRSEILEELSNELIRFVKSINMGEFYGTQLNNLLSSPPRGYITFTGDPEENRIRGVEEHKREYIEKLLTNTVAAEGLLVELLRYQGWKYK